MDIAATVDSMIKAGSFCSCETCRKLQIEWGERIAAESRRQAETERDEAKRDLAAAREALRAIADDPNLGYAALAASREGSRNG